MFLSLIVSLLSGLTAFLNLNETASRHRNAAESLHALWRDCKNWETDFPDASQCEAAVKRVQIYRQRLNEINRDAPQIPRWAWKSVENQRREGSVSYRLEKKAGDR
ncbi:SLATT domain-containing protein [Methylobacterium terrae]|uniref:SLATT domain-containing protein n=1 Tax=Methylobacterium terrae TaxID=2202827 RepID=UPI0013A5435B